VYMFLCIISVLVGVTFTCIYSVNYISEIERNFREQIKTLKDEVKDSLAEVDTLHDKLSEAENQLAILKIRGDRALDVVHPWERCMRFHVRHECEPGSPGDVPCIVDVLGDMVLAISEAFEKAKLTHFIAYGTLLGAVRNQKIIPWTTDVDLVIDSGNWTGLAKTLKNSNVLAKHGLKFFFDPGFGKDLGRICISEDAKKWIGYAKNIPEKSVYYDTGYPYVDIYKGIDVPNMVGKYRVMWGPGCTFNKSDIYPLGKVDLLGHKFAAPRNPDAILSQIYGPDYITPPAKKGMHGNYAQSCKNG